MKRFAIKAIHPESDSEWFVRINGEVYCFDTIEEAGAMIAKLPLIDKGHGYYDIVDCFADLLKSTSSSTTP